MLYRNGALIFSVNTPAPVIDVLPSAKRFIFKGRELIAVKHTLDAAKVLNNIGLKAPSPIMTDGYDWPGRFTPMKHQYSTSAFATLNNKCFILNGMGTGKTGAALWAADYMKQRGHIKRVLIVCPLSVIGVWIDEAFSVLPHVTIEQAIGKKERRLEVIHGHADICVINFDGLSTFYHEERHPKTNRLLKRWSEIEDVFDLIIVDEAAAYRNGTTNRYKALKQVNKPNTKLWLMGATPTPNSPTDAWAQIKLVSPNNVPTSFKTFRDMVMIPAGPYKFVPKGGSAEQVFKLMVPSVRFTKAECLDLPPITYNNRPCDLTPEQVKVFSDIRQKMKFEREEQPEISAANAAVKVIKLQQVCTGVVKDDRGEPVYLDCAPRLALLDELIEQCSEKVIVFAPFIFAMDMIQAHLSKSYTCALVNGGTPKAERDSIFRAFQREKDPKVLIAHPQVAAHGLTLTKASTIIWYAPIYSIEQYEQANGRIERKGQENAMSIYHIGSHAFEWAIYDVLRKKASIQNALLALFEEAVG